MIQYLFIFLFGCFGTVNAAERIVNVYVWGGEIPKSVVHQFEASTGIRVNFSAYDSNETLYAKLKASPKGVYDVILPSSYFVERMIHQNMLIPLDHHRLNNLKHLEPLFTNNDYDPQNHYSVPLIWGATGLFYNTQFQHKTLESWSQLWEPGFQNKLLLLDDAREIFSMALMSLGYAPEDVNPQHIYQAYEKLLTLIPNIKLFSSEGIQAMLIDEDASAGVVWNGDAVKAHTENKSVEFVFPNDGFVIWVDCLAIPTNAAHLDEAYQFINFMLRPEVAATIGITQGHSLTNSAGKAMLPPTIRNNPTVYPSPEILSRGHFQRDPGEKTVALINQYWQQLKLAF